MAVHGSVAPGFEPVREALARVLEQRGELGAACAATVGGTLVVDLWGGLRDRRTGAPWEENTLVMPFSVTKGLAALALALLNARGLLDYGERVAAYWPEFAQAGKGRITVAQLLAHQAGLCVLDEGLSIADLADLDRVADALARQAPLWKPGTLHGYHTSTLGLYECELVRRVDPSGRSLGRVVRDELAAPLGVEMHIGLPDDVPAERVATVETIRPPLVLRHARTMSPRLVFESLNPRSLIARSVRNPRIRARDLNDRAYWRVEHASNNALVTVRGLASAFGAFAAGGAALGVGPDTLQALERPAPPPTRGTRDAVLLFETSYSLGCSKPVTRAPYGSGIRTFGAPGLGGGIAYADPETRSAFAFVPNRHGYHIDADPRELAVRAAFLRCLEAVPEG